MILKYSKDKLFFVVLYIALFAVLSGTRTMIEIVQYDGISYAYQDEIKLDLEDFEQNCQILNSSVTCDSDGVFPMFAAYPFDVAVASGNVEDFELESNYMIIAHEDQLSMYVAGIDILQIPIEELPEELQSIDLSDLESPETREQLYTGISKTLVQTKAIWGTSVMLSDFFVNMVMYLGFVLISTFFLRRRYRIIPFRDAFTLSTYSSTSVFVVLIFYGLLNLPFFLVLILIFFAFRQNTIMTYEIERRLKKPLDKE